MFPIISRMLLLALLIGDWAWDTHFGSDAFTRPMSSSNVTHCTSIARPNFVVRADPFPHSLHVAPHCMAVDLIVPSAVCDGLFESQFPSSYRDPLYVFMSLRC
jgi:hypothetical protein